MDKLLLSFTVTSDVYRYFILNEATWNAQKLAKDGHFEQWFT